MKVTIELTASYDTVKDEKKARAKWTLTVQADVKSPEVQQQVIELAKKGGTDGKEE